MVDNMTNVSKPSFKKITSYVDGLTNEDLQNLKITLKGLDTVNTKKNQTRKEWIREHIHRENIARFYIEGIDDLIDELVDENNDTKGKLKKVIIDQIRSKQQAMGQTTLLINAPRLSQLNTLINWINNPELQNIVSTYKPRTGNKLFPKIKAPDVDIEIKSWRITDFNSEIIMDLINKSPFPLQNLEIEIKSADEDYTLGLDKVTGDNVSIKNNKLIIEFVKASMDEDHHVEQIRIYTNGSTEAEIFHFYISQDFPATNKRINTIIKFGDI